MYDMLRVNTNFEVDPLRLQFFSLNRIIMRRLLGFKTELSSQFDSGFQLFNSRGFI